MGLFRGFTEKHMPALPPKETGFSDHVGLLLPKWLPWSGLCAVLRAVGGPQGGWVAGPSSPEWVVAWRNAGAPVDSSLQEDHPLGSLSQRFHGRPLSLDLGDLGLVLGLFTFSDLPCSIWQMGIVTAAWP